MSVTAWPNPGSTNYAAESAAVIANMRTGVYNVLDYDTPADAFAAADTVPRGTVVFPAGTHEFDTITWRGQSIIGAGSNLTFLKGKPGQDVLVCDPTLAADSRANVRLEGFTIIVDDSEDASSDFPERGGVGNAGFAQDFADGSGTPPFSPIYANWRDVRFQGLSELIGGQNNSCGIYDQYRMAAIASFDHIIFYRLRYGWWQDYPTSNADALELARDHNQVNWVYFNGCHHSMRFVNCNSWDINTFTSHASTGTAIEFVGVQSAFRDATELMRFANVMIEDPEDAIVFTGNVRAINMDVVSTIGSTNIPNWAADNCTVRNWTHGAGSGEHQLTVSGDRNDIELRIGNSAPTSLYMRDAVLNTGVGNRITVFDQSAQTDIFSAKQRVSSSVPEKHVPDAVSLLLGYTDPPFVSGTDLLIHPLDIKQSDGATYGVDFTHVADATADHGVALRWLNNAKYMNFAGDVINGINGFVVGKMLPKSKVRVYLKAKAATGGTQDWRVYDNPTTTSYGGATHTLTTSYAVYSWDIDLSAAADGDDLMLWAAPIGGGGAVPVDIAWVMFRPYAKDVLIHSEAWNGGHLVMGSYHLWIDSTGDLRIKSSAPSSDTDGSVIGGQS